jgi:glycosyltransferase involved in cell wall biosynthesis
LSRARPLRVAFLIGTAEPGGAERRLWELLEQLDRRRIQPILLLFRAQGELLPQCPADIPVAAIDDDLPGSTLAGVAQRWCRSLKLPAVARMARLATLLRRSEIDLLCDWMAPVTLEACWPTLLAGCPRVSFTALDPDYDQQLLPSWCRGLLPFCYRRSALVITNSEQSRQRIIERFHVPSDRVRYVPSTRNLGKLEGLAAAPPDSAADVVRWPGAGPRIVAMGRLAPQKDHRTLLLALQQMGDKREPPQTLSLNSPSVEDHPSPAAQLVILGNGSLWAALESFSRQCGLGEQVRFLGHQRNPYRWLVSADVFVLSSRAEGMPNALLEAMALGVPVVSTDCPTGPREILDGGRWGELVPVGDVAGLAAAIQRVISDLPSARARAALAQSMVLEQYRIEKRVREIEEVLCDAGRARSASRRPSPEPGT